MMSAGIVSVHACGSCHCTTTPHVLVVVAGYGDGVVEHDDGDGYDNAHEASDDC